MRDNLYFAVMCKNNEQMCKNFYEDGDRSIFFYKERILKQSSVSSGLGDWLSKFQSPVGTRQPINAVEINAY